MQTYLYNNYCINALTIENVSKNANLQNRKLYLKLYFNKSDQPKIQCFFVEHNISKYKKNNICQYCAYITNVSQSSLS